MVHVRQVVEDVKGQVNVNLVQAASLFAKRSDLLLLRRRLFRLLQSLVVVFGDFGSSGVFKKAVNLLFELLKLFLFRLLFLLFNLGLGSMGRGGALRHRLTLEASSSVGFHRSAETLGCARDVGARADCTALVR